MAGISRDVPLDPVLEASDKMLLDYNSGTAKVLRPDGTTEDLPAPVYERIMRELFTKMGPIASAAIGSIQYYDAEWGCPDQTGVVDSDCPVKALNAGVTNIVILTAATAAMNLSPRWSPVVAFNKKVASIANFVTNKLVDTCGASWLLRGSHTAHGKARTAFSAKAMLSGALKGVAIGGFSMAITSFFGVPVTEAMPFYLGFPALAGLTELVVAANSRAWKGAPAYLPAELRARTAPLMGPDGGGGMPPVPPAPPAAGAPTV